MNGQLGEQPVAELIREISSKNFSGTLRLERERVRAALYFDTGKLIYAAANIRSLRLRQLLTAKELISETELSNHNQQSDVELVTALSKSGVLSADAIAGVLMSQVKGVLGVVLLWGDGSWNFDERTRLVDPIRVDLGIEHLLMEIARRMEPAFISTRFRNPQELISPVLEPPQAINLQPAEGFVLSRVETPIRLQELISISGLGDLETYRMIYTLALGGYLEREGWDSVFPDRPMPTRTEQPFPDVKPEAPPVAPPSESDEEKHLEDYLSRIGEAGSHYEVLDVGTTAQLKEIKRAYYMLARRYHPDRFRVSVSKEVHARMESAFARITQAYETLTDPGRRSTYDGKLAAQARARQFANSAPKSGRDAFIDPLGGTESEPEFQGAEANFKEGFAALQQGQTNLAVTLLGAAARKEPKEARYRAYYGRALAGNARTRRLAEAELLAAIKLDPNQAAYRLMLAELYCDLGFLLRAQNEAERVVASEPGNSAAQELFRRLKSDTN
ncbi:MAG TPA: DUF4388 domain-containing protein [Pyrinomonadaceae bacterium]|nr:DUF4388 domain-containing protein [Pyrinomonadaceae bacterium]